MINNLPTDNLYKFCAILGLFLIVFNSYYNFEMLSTSDLNSIKLEGDYKKIMIEYKNINELLKKSISNNRQFKKKSIDLINL